MDARDVGLNSWLIEEMYQQYLENPESVSDTWKEFFADYQPAGNGQAAVGNGQAAEQVATEPEARAHVTPAPRPEPTPAPVAEPRPAERKPEAPADVEAVALRGADAALVKHMEASLTVPTATSVRTIPAKLLEVNRNILNRHLARARGAKVSFTHLIAFAILRALDAMPGMRTTYADRSGKPHAQRHDAVNLGLAIDVRRPDGSRTLVVPNIKDATRLEFSEFFSRYEDLVKRALSNKLTLEDYAGTTHTITNPGMIGTVQSVPRLMAGQAVIVGVGAIGHPAEYEAADPRMLAEMGVGKVVTLTSTYDHRVIQGAESGEFLRTVHKLLLGEQGFYDEIFRSMRVPYVPVRWRHDVQTPEDGADEAEEKQAKVLQLINLYRVRGHLIAPLDPLEAEPPSMHPELDPASYGLTIWDLDRQFFTGGLAGRRKAALGEILGILRDAYCRTATVEYMHIQEPEQKAWIQERVEGVSIDLEPADRRQILHKLNQAEAFERFLHSKFVGHKRFSLEGAESLIPMLDAVLDHAADAMMNEVVIGMSHRGRLNVLANTVRKSYSQIFREFEGDIDPDAPQGSGDVKYHMGAAGMHTSRSGTSLAVTVASNPSHLEAVDPVVEGIVRAKQDALGRGIEFPVLPVLIHGDSAFAGQGVVAETLNLSQLSGYRTGGTIHLIVNNQLGFTTGWNMARSSTYASDVAKMVQAPIFHVNGDDPEACVRVARLAFAFRQRFHKDVVIDMWCYRRWGHNEADDPSMTQPLMYARIENRRSVRKLYTEALVNRGDMTLEEAEQVLEEFQEELRHAFDETKQAARTPAVEWKQPAALTGLEDVRTGIDRGTLEKVLAGIVSVPEGFEVHKRLVKWLEQRAQALDADSVDWSLAEALAFGSLVMEGRTVRLSGEDTRRGTFSQRHSVLVDQRTGEEYIPLAHIPGAEGRFFAYDSLLSEFAVVGFEYGYSVAAPEALVCWEAQFGDFVNGAQVIIDQFLAAAEDKWGQRSRLVLLLPHGYEGQGPEHSSARLERFLADAAEDNYQVVVPTTPAQYFHVLRRQAVMPVAKPLVVMTPKSLLRHPAVRSPADDLGSGSFQPVLVDGTLERARRVLLCQGKIVYDLLEARGERDDVVIVRVEQLYPWPSLTLPDGADVIWVQEEPANMGAWRFVRERLGPDVRVVARESSASPASGSLKVHQKEQAALLRAALGDQAGR